MRVYRVSLAAAAVAAVTVMQAHWARAKGPKVSEDLNKHNLSSRYFPQTQLPTIPAIDSKLGGQDRDASIRYKAKYDPLNHNANRLGFQVCVFCHTPHNSTSVAPLWNRRPTSVTSFGRYSSATLQIRTNSLNPTAQYTAGWQPDGSSKLCLSCHDGVSALGNVYSGYIAMANNNDVITGRASFNPSTNKMKLGHHPVSFVYNPAVQQGISSGRAPSGGFSFSWPPKDPRVKLDRSSKMQCTTCHDPHQSQSEYDTTCYNNTATGTIPCGFQNMSSRKVVPFWALGGGVSATADHDTVCTACHVTNLSPYNKAPFPPHP